MLPSERSQSHLLKVKMGVSQREDRYKLPPKELLPWTWNKLPINDDQYSFRMMKDATSSAGNAAIEIWEQGDATKVDIGMCSFHGFQRWRDLNKGLLCNGDNSELMNTDFESFKKCPFLSVINILRNKMVNKWIVNYKEEKFAEAWIKSWGNFKMTRIEMNQNSVICGSITSDNNGIEGTNGADKLIRNHKRSKLSNFIQEFASDLGNKSQRDIIFVKGLHKKVNNLNFY